MEQLLDSFLKQLRTTFSMEFDHFNLALKDLNEAQQQSTEYTKQLYETMSGQLSDSVCTGTEEYENLGGRAWQYAEGITCILRRKS